jgi:hypothetical protein
MKVETAVRLAVAYRRARTTDIAHATTPVSAFVFSRSVESWPDVPTPIARSTRSRVAELGQTSLGPLGCPGSRIDIGS